MSDNLNNLFKTLSKKYRSVLQQNLSEFNLYVGQPPVLFCIAAADNGKITQRELTCMMKTSKESMSVTISRLENNGFVLKSQDQEDRRVQWISLTDMGKEIVVLLNKKYSTINNAMYQYLSEAERTMLQVVFEKMIQSLNEQERD